jgi:hypothetical protein
VQTNQTPNLSLNPDASPAALRAVRSAPVRLVVRRHDASPSIHLIPTPIERRIKR